MPKVSVKLKAGKPVAVTTPSDGPAVIVPADAERGKAETLALVPAFQLSVTALDVVDDVTYEQADVVFGRIKAARKGWASRMEAIVRPIRRGLDALYALNRDVDKPLALLEQAVESKMKTFKLAELQAKRAAEQAQARTLAALEEKRDRLVTPAAKARVETQIVDVQNQTFETVTGVHSAARPVKALRVTDEAAFVAAVAQGEIPADCVEISWRVLRQYYKEDAATVKAWPGVEEYDDVQIAGR